MLVLRRGGKTGVPGEKPLRARKRTNNKLNPHVTPGPGNEPGPHWWEASALPTAPSLLPSQYSPFKGILIFPWIKLITSHFSLQTSISSSFVLIGGQNTSSVVYCPHSNHRAFFRELVRARKNHGLLVRVVRKVDNAVD